MKKIYLFQFRIFIIYMCTELPASAEECHLKKTFHEKRRTSHFIMNCVCFFWYPEIFNIKRYDGDNKEFRGSKLG